MTTQLPDQNERDRFQYELDQNFSVIAPAGVGKTTSIVNRIAYLSQTDAARETRLLPRLVLVTYTNKAADEMRERARQRILSADRQHAHSLMHFNQSFFGTIHSFCLDLLRRYGFHLGLGSSLSLIDNEEGLWLSFLRSTDAILEILPTKVRRVFSNYADLSKVIKLARTCALDSCPDFILPNPPHLDFNSILQFEGNKRNEKFIAIQKRMLQRWLLDAQKNYPVGIPVCKKGGKDFKEEWNASMQPLRHWLSGIGHYWVNHIAHLYQQFRIKQGFVRYDDMIQLTRQLLTHSEANKAIFDCQYRIILDEAQDTDPEQFDILLACVQQRSKPVLWSDEPKERLHIAPGHFCMVGDPQQSIYSDRADLNTYLAIHDSLSSSEAGDALTFQVTMRCDRQIVNCVNQCFPNILDGQSGQVSFVDLCERPWAKEGRVQRFIPEMVIPEGKLNARQKLELEAQAIANFLFDKSPQDFGIDDWSKLAILCPRRQPLSALVAAFQQKGIPCQNHSRLDLMGDFSAYAWMCALCTVIAEPQNSFEVCGVLREVFALSDDAIGRYTLSLAQNGSLHPLEIGAQARGDGPVAEALDVLTELRRQALKLPLFQAFHYIVDSLQLKERLCALPGKHLELLDEISCCAADAEAAELSFTEWAAGLRSRYQQSAAERHPESGHIQLLTCQKAKGLEWPVVMLPFFHTPISQARVAYPYISKIHAAQAGKLIWDSQDHSQDLKEQIQLKHFQTMQRLLYVATTRACDTLILVDDSALYSGDGLSMAQCMGTEKGEGNFGAWNALPEWKPFEAEQTEKLAMAERPMAGRHRLHIDDKFFDTNKLCIKDRPFDGSKLAFIKRVLPSSLSHSQSTDVKKATHKENDLEPLFPETSSLVSGGADYGNWWHDTMEFMPWGQGLSACEVYWKEQFDTCPDPERGQDECERFLLTETASFLTRENVVVRAEVPLFFRDDALNAYDGSIDLLAQDLTTQEYWVLDWKTDIIKKDISELIERYQAQLKCYKKGVAIATQCEVKLWLYSTRLGQCVEIRQHARNKIRSL